MKFTVDMSTFKYFKNILNKVISSNDRDKIKGKLIKSLLKNFLLSGNSFPWFLAHYTVE